MNQVVLIILIKIMGGMLGRTHRICSHDSFRLHPRHLSLFERVVLKRDRHYDAERDRDMKIQELRQLYEKLEVAKLKEHA